MSVSPGHIAPQASLSLAPSLSLLKPKVHVSTRKMNMGSLDPSIYFLPDGVHWINKSSYLLSPSVIISSLIGMLEMGCWVSSVGAAWVCCLPLKIPIPIPVKKCEAQFCLWQSREGHLNGFILNVYVKITHIYIWWHMYIKFTYPYVFWVAPLK